MIKAFFSRLLLVQCVILRRELRYLVLVLMISLLLASLAVLVYTRASFHSASSGAYVYSYKAAFIRGGVLKEQYDYAIAVQRYHMLYRRWLSPLYLSDQAKTSYIEFLRLICPKGFIGYVYTHDKSLYVLSPFVPKSIQDDIARRLTKAKTRDETGCYNPATIRPGLYSAFYAYRLHAPLSCDESSCVLDLELASPGKHIYYRSLTIWLPSSVKHVWLVPNTIKISIDHGDTGWVIRGCCLYEEQGLRLIMLIPQGFVTSPGVVKQVDNAEKAAHDIVSGAGKGIVVAKYMGLVGIVFAVSAPVMILAVYFTRGREAEPRRPIPQGFPPDTGEKPWQVNLLYRGEVGVFTWEAVPATLLDLAARGIISIRRDENGVVIELHDEDTGKELDSYEKDVVSLLRLLSSNDRVVVLSEEKADKEKIKKMAAALYGSAAYKGLARSAVKPYRKPFAAALLLGIVAVMTHVALRKVLWIGDLQALYRSVAAWLLGASSYIPPLLAPSYVFGRWREGYLEKFLAWSQFRKRAKEVGLSSAGMLSLSGEWLRVAAYLVALGEAGLVEKELRRLGEEVVAAYLDTIRFFRGFYRHYYPRAA